MALADVKMAPGCDSGKFGFEPQTSPHLKELLMKELEIERVQALNVQPDETLVFTVDVQNLPRRLANERMMNISEFMKRKLPGSQVLVIDNSIKLEKFKTADLKGMKDVPSQE